MNLDKIKTCGFKNLWLNTNFSDQIVVTNLGNKISFKVVTWNSIFITMTRMFLLKHLIVSFAILCELEYVCVKIVTFQILQDWKKHSVFSELWNILTHAARVMQSKLDKFITNYKNWNLVFNKISCFEIFVRRYQMKDQFH